MGEVGEAVIVVDLQLAVLVAVEAEVIKVEQQVLLVRVEMVAVLLV